jgi:hypothetical protein
MKQQIIAPSRQYPMVQMGMNQFLLSRAGSLPLIYQGAANVGDFSGVLYDIITAIDRIKAPGWEALVLPGFLRGKVSAKAEWLSIGNPLCIDPYECPPEIGFRWVGGEMGGAEIEPYELTLARLTDCSTGWEGWKRAILDHCTVGFAERVDIARQGITEASKMLLQLKDKNSFLAMTSAPGSNRARISMINALTRGIDTNCVLVASMQQLLDASAD